MATTGIKFRDINISFKKHPVTDDIVLSKDASAIKQAIVNILLTNKGERLFNFEFGSSIRQYLFEPLDFATAGQVSGSIKSTLSKFEPRIGVTDVSVLPNYDDNGFDVELSYVIRGADTPPVNVEFFLARTR
jgi:phage baseplate assembly protein W